MPVAYLGTGSHSNSVTANQYATVYHVSNVKWWFKTLVVFYALINYPSEASKIQNNLDFAS